MVWLWISCGVVLAHAPFAAVAYFYLGGSTGAWLLSAVVAISFVRKCASVYACAMRGSLRGKHVVITGGSQGLGKALAEMCVREGALVTIVSRSRAKLEAAKQETGAHCAISLDLSTATSADIAKALQAAAEGVGGRHVDVFIANAGTGHARLVIPSSSDLDSYISGLVDLNTKGTLLAVTEAARAMRMSGGRICIVSSAAGIISLPGYAYYSATKFGHRGVVAGAYHELKRSGILLGCFYPGSMLTPGYEEELEDRPDITHRIESSCSDTCSPESAAKSVLHGIKTGAREWSNEPLAHLALDAPTGCLHLDLAIAATVSIIKAGWDIYLQFAALSYLPSSSEPSAKKNN